MPGIQLWIGIDGSGKFDFAWEGVTPWNGRIAARFWRARSGWVWLVRLVLVCPGCRLVDQDSRVGPGQDLVVVGLETGQDLVVVGPGWIVSRTGPVVGWSTWFGPGQDLDRTWSPGLVVGLDVSRVGCWLLGWLVLVFVVG